MKKILMFMAIMIAAFSMVACSSDSREDNIHEDTQKTLADYDGVWEDEDNDTLFISISANGNIKYYCGSIYMGNGIGVLNGNTLVVPNEYTGMTDEFELSGSVDNLRLKCKLKDGINKDAYCSITLNLHKTNESLALFTGDVWMPKLYFGSTDRKSWQQWRMQVTSNNSSLYYLHHNTYGIMKQYGLYSIQRQYKNKYKFLYSHFSDNDDHKIVVFSWDGEFIRNNKNIPN